MMVKRLVVPVRKRKGLPKGYKSPVLKWLPDWKDEANYTALEKATAKQWAWEFLRRNPHYHGLRSIYSIRERTLDAVNSIVAVRGRDGTLIIKNPKNAPARYCNAVRMFNLYFGLLHFPPLPSESNPKLRLETIIEAEAPKSLYKGKRFHSRNFPTYLRVLDAHMTNYGIGATAKVLFKELSEQDKRSRIDNSTETNFKKTIQSRLRTAKEIRDKYFRLIPLIKM